MMMNMMMMMMMMIVVVVVVVKVVVVIIQAQFLIQFCIYLHIDSRAQWSAANSRITQMILKR
jgi:hypothetical protein